MSRTVERKAWPALFTYDTSRSSPAASARSARRLTPRPRQPDVLGAEHVGEQLERARVGTRRLAQPRQHAGVGPREVLEERGKLPDGGVSATGHGGDHLSRKIARSAPELRSI